MANKESPIIASDFKDVTFEHTDYTENGRCSKCGSCCSNALPLFPSEIRRIRDYIKANHISPCHHNNMTEDSDDDSPSVDMLCPFLDTHKSEHKCNIYPVRPYICKCYICKKDAAHLVQANFQEFTQNYINTHPADKDGIGIYNLAQTFYPKEYVPLPGDLVIINTMSPMFDTCQGMPFKVMPILRPPVPDPNANSLTVRIHSMDNKLRLWINIQELTKLEWPKDKKEGTP